MKHIRSNRASIRRLFFMAIAAFLLIFLLRFSYEIIFTRRDIIVTVPSPAHETYSFRRHLFNVATEKITQTDITGNIITIDQKYEKTANISSVSHRFDEDHELLRELIDTHDAIVQSESLQGLPGNQVLTITIGVTPQHFDILVNFLRELGTLRSFTVNRVDKTNDFNNLLAQQEVLLKARDSYVALQELGGSIQDMLLLHERIRIVETELQHLGVDLDIFASEHSFCTINLVLREQEASFISIQFIINSAFDSFLWTLAAVVVVSLLMLGLLGVVTLGLWLRIVIGRQLQVSDLEDVEISGVSLEEDDD